MVDLTNNSILLENEANLATPTDELQDILTKVREIIPKFFKAKLFGTGIDAQIHLVCSCSIGSTMGVLYVKDLTRSNITAKVTEVFTSIYSNCNNECPDGYII